MPEQEKEELDLSSFQLLKQQGKMRGEIASVKKALNALFTGEVFAFKPNSEIVLALPHAYVVREFMTYNLDTSPNEVCSRVKLLMPLLDESAITEYYAYLKENFRVLTKDDLPEPPALPEWEMTPAQRTAHATAKREFKTLVDAAEMHNQRADGILTLAVTLLDHEVFGTLPANREGLAAATVRMNLRDHADIRRFCYGLKSVGFDPTAFQGIDYEMDGETTVIRFWFPDEEVATRYALGYEHLVNVYVQFSGDTTIPYFMRTATIEAGLADGSLLPPQEGEEKPINPDEKDLFTF